MSSTDPGCLNCPVGGDCVEGGDTVHFAKGSWVITDGMFVLRSCSIGHKVINSSALSNTFSHDSQICQLCGKGEQCNLESCEICAPCQAGYYKSAVSTEACMPCPANTFREEAGATDLGMCLGCQLKSSTLLLAGQSSARACVCDMDYYPITTNTSSTSESLLCQTCPKGAVCGNGECALRNSNFTCSDGTSVGSRWQPFVGTDRGMQVHKRILSCPAGFKMQRDPLFPQLDNCEKCSQNFYLLKPVDWQGPNTTLPSCSACPKGATCAGGNIVEASAGFWRFQTQLLGGYEYLHAASDMCQEAQEGVECLFPVGFHVLQKWSDAPMHCTRLPEVSTGLVCARPSNNTLQRRTAFANGRAFQDPTLDVGIARIYRCMPGACDSNNSCGQNRTGPLCGFCSPGYAMTTQGCSRSVCASQRELTPMRMTLIICTSVCVLVLWFIMSWRPVVPEVDAVGARVFSSISGMACGYKCFKCFDSSHGTILGGLKDKVKTTGAWFHKNQGFQFVKIYISSFQILGSFSMFAIEWPPEFTTAINWVKGILSLDFFKLSFLNCLWNDVDFHTYLHIYTLAPLVLITMLALPLVVARYRGLHLTALDRNRETYDRFWTNIMFSFFILYPALSISTMSVFNCNPNVGRLREDYRVVCPHLTSGTGVYSIIFFFIYPIGIPLCMHLALRFAGIICVTKKKVEKAQFHAARGLFMKLYVTTEMHRFARLVGNVDDNEEEFLRQAKEEFGRLLVVQGDGGDELDLEKMRNIAREDQTATKDLPTLEPTIAKIARSPCMIPMASARMEVESQAHMVATTYLSIVNSLQLFDANGDGKTNFPEFCTMIKEARSKANLFTGTEDLDILNEKQLQELLIFHAWPTNHRGPGDLVDREGMGGLVEIVNKLKKDENYENDPEERAARTMALAPGGDRSDPELVKIDAVAQYMEEREKSGHLCESYTSLGHKHSQLNRMSSGVGSVVGWQADIKKAEALYVANPAEVSAFVEKMSIKELPMEEKRMLVRQLIHRLIQDDITAIPPLVWQSTSAENEGEDAEISEDDRIMNRFGFIFVAYRVEWWWWESVEMLRKLLMTSILIFIMPGTPGQLFTGAMIAFVFLILNLHIRPFCTAGLNSLSIISLIAQFLTLFVGIIIALLDASPSNGVDNVSQVHHTLITVVVLLLNVTTLAWPILRKILSGTYLDYYEKLVGFYTMLYDNVYIRCCGSKEQKTQMERTAAKIKAREERKQMREKQTKKDAQIDIAEMLPHILTRLEQENGPSSSSCTQDTKSSGTAASTSDAKEGFSHEKCKGNTACHSSPAATNQPNHDDITECPNAIATAPSLNRRRAELHLRIENSALDTQATRQAERYTAIMPPATLTPSQPENSQGSASCTHDTQSSGTAARASDAKEGVSDEECKRSTACHTSPAATNEPNHNDITECPNALFSPAPSLNRRRAELHLRIENSALDTQATRQAERYTAIMPPATLAPSQPDDDRSSETRASGVHAGVVEHRAGVYNARSRSMGKWNHTSPVATNEMNHDAMISTNQMNRNALTSTNEMNPDAMTSTHEMDPDAVVITGPAHDGHTALGSLDQLHATMNQMSKRINLCSGSRK